MKASLVLRKAGDVLRERGWCQGSASEQDGRVCAIGAMRVATCGDPEILPNGLRFDDYSSARDLVSDVAGGEIVAFNDSAMTVDEVLVAMDAAYVLALQEEGTEPEDVL